MKRALEESADVPAAVVRSRRAQAPDAYLAWLPADIFCRVIAPLLSRVDRWVLTMTCARLRALLFGPDVVKDRRQRRTIMLRAIVECIEQDNLTRLQFVAGGASISQKLLFMYRNPEELIGRYNALRILGALGDTGFFDWSAACVAAARHGHVNVLEYICNRHAIRAGFQELAENGAAHLGVFKWLRWRGCLPQRRQLQEASNRAAQQKAGDVVRYLHKERGVVPSEFAVVCLASNDDLATLRWALRVSCRRVSLNLLRAAVEGNSLEVVGAIAKEAFHSGVCKSAAEELFVCAARRGNTVMIDRLWCASDAYTGIPERAFMEAAARCDLNMLKYLHAHPGRPVAIDWVAVLEAAERNYAVLPADPRAIQRAQVREWIASVRGE